jgi:hypothetical protein
VSEINRPEVCVWCEGLLDGSEREAWVDGVRIWVHRQCEKPYLAFLVANPKHEIGAFEA